MCCDIHFFCCCYFCSTFCLFARRTNPYPIPHSCPYNNNATEIFRACIKFIFFHCFVVDEPARSLSVLLVMTRFYGMQEICAISFYWRPNGSVLIILCGTDGHNKWTKWELIGLDVIVNGNTEAMVSPFEPEAIIFSHVITRTDNWSIIILMAYFFYWVL